MKKKQQFHLEAVGSRGGEGRWNPHLFRCQTRKELGIRFFTKILSKTNLQN
jgi:hypothetical protein